MTDAVINVLCSATTPSLRFGWPFARFSANPEQILVTLLWIWPENFPREELMPLRIEDGALLIQSQRTGRRVRVSLDLVEILPILKAWGYPVFRETAPAKVSAKSRRLEPDPPL